jgi:VIT1/CCC1 family predicted Fe2+/Mn2+ transporter
MEDLAALVATILAVFVGMAVINILLAVLSRRKKIRPWIAMVFNALTGFAAIFGISISWAVGIVPLMGLIIGSIILTLPNRKRR